MSKFCPMCNTVTNCTDNCNACLKEEEKNEKNVKVYYTDDGTYTFDIIEEHQVKVPLWYAKCRENGKMAWLDREGVQFEREGRVRASTKQIQTARCYITYEHDPVYPDDCIPITRFHRTLEEAKAYAERIERLYNNNIYVDIYEAKMR
jgi:hypothetical protein